MNPHLDRDGNINNFDSSHNDDYLEVFLSYQALWVGCGPNPNPMLGRLELCVWGYTCRFCHDVDFGGCYAMVIVMVRPFIITMQGEYILFTVHCDDRFSSHSIRGNLVSHTYQEKEYAVYCDESIRVWAGVEG